ncbi:hypothetical protein BAnh1_06050 [Bartonella australis AUST/NH1]|uniref:Uncharacterized protein n=1 Tax=Bartonella australis (strain Aust/NH1) TaxID=1094489 RepID=M1N3L3_BARAA|nr:hypothetical protein BAnh1_06050 [Bartonella australis AUST/NH1]
MADKKRAIRRKNIQSLNEKEFKLLLELLDHYEKFKIFIWIVKRAILFIFVFTFELPRFIDAIDNCVTHIKKWFLKL